MKKCLVILTIIFINLLLSTPSFSGCSMPTDFSVPHTERGVTYSDVLHLYDACAGHEMTLFYNPDNSQGYPAFRVYGGWQWWIQVTEAIWYYDGNLYGCDENNIQLYVPQITNQSIGQMGIDSGCRTNYVSTQNAYNYYSPYALFLSANSFQLTVSPDPVAGGGVASSDDKIQCGVNQLNYCQTDYLLDSEVELEAFPHTGYAFAYWDDGTNQYTDNPHTFTMDQALEVTAAFKPLFTFPLYNYTSTTVPISAVMDHSVFDTTPVQFYQTDDIVRAFNGEIGDKQYGYSYTNDVWGYLMNLNQDEFLSGHTYTEGSYLFYDGHPGFDFAVSAGTDVLAPFDGKLYWATSDPVNGSPGTFGTFYIDHENGYTTWFLHCSGLVSAVATEVQQNGFAQVTKGDHIAESGNTGTTGYHLHFEVRKGRVDDENVIDPFKEELWE